jgi:isopropylmalate/homocitrate/citramalate synthase
MNVDKKDILVVDQTIREGMQHRGLMFSYEERMKIIDFQNQLKVDISVAAYPPAHETERVILYKINKQCIENAYRLKPAGHCRALLGDVKFLIESGINQFHLHSGISRDLIGKFGEKKIFSNLIDAINYIRKNSEHPVIEVSLLDVGKTDKQLLKKLASYLINDLEVDILTLPDTSGVMQPMSYYDVVADICKLNTHGKTQISAHCHNDLGMAVSNTIMGVLAGASVIEVSAFGIGERNGIGDLFVIAKVLNREGFRIKLNIENVALFKAYYHYVNELYLNKIGEPILNFNTPFFGASAVTHVAGTHGIGEYGIDGRKEETDYYFNVLTGKNNLKKFSDLNGLDIDDNIARESVKKIKDLSATMQRCLHKEEVITIIRKNMDMKNLEKALKSFMDGDMLVSDLARILFHVFQDDRVHYQDLASAACGNMDEALLALWEWKLVIPVRSLRCSEWDSRILSTEPKDLYEMPNISKALVKKGIETGTWNSTAAILDLFQYMGEMEWEKMPDLILSIKKNTLHNTINGAKIGILCIQNRLKDKTGAMIAILKGAGVISPKLAAINRTAKAKSPLYEFNPSVYAEL